MEWTGEGWAERAVYRAGRLHTADRLGRSSARAGDEAGLNGAGRTDHARDWSHQKEGEKAVREDTLPDSPLLAATAGFALF